MPLKIIPPRNSKTKNLYIRGTYLGRAVDKSCGTDRRSVARILLKRIEGEIERGEYQVKAVPPKRGAATFMTAAIAYLEAGRRKRYVAKLIKYFGETPLDQLDQDAIDEAAAALHPNAGPGTRNAAVYTPVSAILHHAGVDIKVRRPKGAKGRIVTDWLKPEDANAIISAADQIDIEFATLLRVLLYTGLRLGEVLAWCWDDLRLDEGAAWTRREKDGIEFRRHSSPRSGRSVAGSASARRSWPCVSVPPGRSSQAPVDPCEACCARAALPCTAPDRLARHG